MTDKAALIQKIDQLEGLNPDEKAQLKELLNNQKIFGLVWEDKPEIIESQLLNYLPVLREDKSKYIRAIQSEINEDEAGLNGNENQLKLDLDENEDSDEDFIEDNISLNIPAPHHILIEGDNLHALVSLTFSHKETIDFIYIDPPYNTRKKDFKYNDTYVDPEDSFKHSKWLSFMYRRLLLARQLLNEFGVICISIDDKEQAQLKLLCDQIFGEENSIGPIIQDKQNSKNDAVNVQKNHEYVLIYRKKKLLNSKNKVLPNLLNFKSKPKQVFTDNGKYFFLNDSITTRGEGGILNKRPNLGHTIYFNPTTKEFIAVDDYDLELAKTSNDFSLIYQDNQEYISNGYMPIRPPMVRGKLGCWTWSLDKINAEKDNLFISKKKNGFSVKKRTYVTEDQIINTGSKLLYNSSSNSNSRSILPFSTNDGTETLNNVLGVFDKFNNPKNVDLISYLISLIPRRNIKILDFFAGSGTTLHATLMLNAKGGDNRQCILVTNNENNIAEEVCYVRSKKVIEGYTRTDGIVVAGLTNNHLHYFKADFVPMNPHVDTDSNAYVGALEIRKRITEESLGLLCIKENCFDEVSSGYPYIKHFESESAHLVLITNDMELESAVAYISGLALPKGLVDNDQGEYIKVYVFSPNSYAYESDFAELGHKVKLCALPEAILNAYRHVRNDLELETRDLSIQEEPQPTTLSNIETEDTD